MFRRKHLLFITQSLFLSLLFITVQTPSFVSAMSEDQPTDTEDRPVTRAAKKRAKKQIKKARKKVTRKPVKTIADKKKVALGKPRTVSRKEKRQNGKKSKGYLGEIRAKIDAAPKDADVKLFDLVGDFLSKLKIPKPAQGIFNDKLAIRNITILKDLPSGPAIRSGLGFTGSLFLNKLAVKATMYVVLDTEMRPQYMFVLELPDTYKLSSLFPMLKKLDMFSLPKPKYVLTSFEYKVADGSLRGPGFYFNAELDLSGPLDLLRTLKENAKKLDFIVVRDEPIQFWGKIPVNIGLGGASASVSFGARIPIRFGIDFTKIKQLPPSVSFVFKEFTTDDFELDVTVFPNVSITLESGVRIVLGTQKDPLRFSNIVSIAPFAKRFAIGQRMRNMLDLKWFALGNAGFQLEWDLNILRPIWSTGVPLPVSGLGYYGQIDIGRGGDSRASFKYAAAAKLTGNKMPALLGTIEATNIGFDDLAAFLVSIAQKTKQFKGEFPVDKIPTLRINKLKGYFAPESTTIAKKFFKAGFGFTFDIQLFEQKVVYDVNIEHKALKMTGLGYLSNIIFDVKGKRVFALTGPGLDQKYGTTDDGPIVFCDFNALHPGAAKFGVRARLEIPPLGIKSDTDIVFENKSFKADIETKIGGFTSEFQVTLAPLRIRDTFIKVGFKNDFENVLMPQLKIALSAMKNGAVQELDNINKKVSDFSKQVTEAGKRVSSALDQKVADAQREVSSIQSRISSLKRERSGLRRIQIGKKAVLTAKIAAERAKLGVKQAALAVLLRSAQAVVKGTTQAVEEITKKLTEAKLLQKALSATVGNLSKALDGVSRGVSPIKIKEVGGGYSVNDMLAGKLPMITLVVETRFLGMPTKTLSLKDVQFDFSDVAKSTAEIAKAILKGAGLKK